MSTRKSLKQLIAEAVARKERNKAQRISELSRWGHLDAAQAEEKFQEVESAQVSASLKRFHGIPAA
jgi:hypothetical protein